MEHEIQTFGEFLSLGLLEFCDLIRADLSTSP